MLVFVKQSDLTIWRVLWASEFQWFLKRIVCIDPFEFQPKKLLDMEVFVVKAHCQKKCPKESSSDFQKTL